MSTSKLYFSSLLLLLPLHCFGAAVGSTIGRVVMSEAGVEAVDAAGNTRPLTRGDVVYSGDRIRTASDGTAQFRMTDGSLLLLKRESEFAFVLYEHDGPGGSPDRVEYYLHDGGMRTITGQIGEDGPDDYLLESDYGELRVRGTTYECVVDGALYCGVYDGGIRLGNAGGILDLGVGTEFDFAIVSSPNDPPVPLLQQPPQLLDP